MREHCTARPEVLVWSAGLWLWVVAVRRPSGGLTEEHVLGLRCRADRIARRRLDQAIRQLPHIVRGSLTAEAVEGGT